MTVLALLILNQKESQRKVKDEQEKKSKKKGIKWSHTIFGALKFRQDFRATEEISEKYPTIETNHLEMQDELLLISNVL